MQTIVGRKRGSCTEEIGDSLQKDKEKVRRERKAGKG